MKKYIGIDIGGTSIKAAIVDESGRLSHTLTEQANINNYSKPLIECVVETAKKIKQIALENNIAIEGIGVSAAGQIDSKTGTVIGTCGNFPGWIGINIKETLEEVFDKDVTVQNDGNCAVLAEKWLGAGKNYDNIIMYTVGTGVGGGLILDGKLFEGSRGIAGEIGHMVFSYNGKECTCKNIGCFEQYASTSALVKLAEEKTGIKDLNGKDVFDLYESGNSKIDEVLDEFYGYHAKGIVSLLHIFNPDIVIIGGGISKQGEKILKPIREKVMKTAMPAFTKDIVITSPEMFNYAGVIGAVRFFRTTH